MPNPTTTPTPTPTLLVMTKYCSVYVNDQRLTDLAQSDMPLYAWRMWGYLLPAISLFTLPDEMSAYLKGTLETPKLTEPKFASYRYTVEQDATSPVTVSLGEEYVGFKLFSCHALEQVDDFGTVEPVPVTLASYNAETGEVTLQASEEAPIPAGTVFDMDFYTDGAFENPLTHDMMNILGLCFRVVWLLRFDTDWLSIVSKIEDKSFTVQNIANKERADRETVESAIKQLNGEMRAYERKLNYNKTFPQGRGLL